MGRAVRVGGADVYFASIEALEARVEEEKSALIALDSQLLAHNQRNPDAWAKVEMQAAILRDLLFGLDDWIKEEEAGVDALIADLRQQIRSL